MATLELRPSALGDVERILEFYGNDPDGGLGRIEVIYDALSILARHPMIGRNVEGELRELVISRGKHRFMALYRYVEPEDEIRILRIRHQRELGYPTR